MEAVPTKSRRHHRKRKFHYHPDALGRGFDGVTTEVYAKRAGRGFNATDACDSGKVEIEEPKLGVESVGDEVERFPEFECARRGLKLWIGVVLTVFALWLLLYLGYKVINPMFFPTPPGVGPAIPRYSS